jgi:sortase A
MYNGHITIMEKRRENQMENKEVVEQQENTDVAGGKNRKRSPIKRGTIMVMLGILMLIGALALSIYNWHKEKVVGVRSEEALEELESLINALERVPDGEKTTDEDWSAYMESYPGTAQTPDDISKGTDAQEEEQSTDEMLPEGVIPGDMSCVLVDGHYYIGVLDMPTLGITLPVQWGWSDSLMDTSPCRYNGTLEDGDLIIMAHNYSTHFGTIFDLAVGDAVSFTDVLGVCTDYEVCGVDIFGRSEISKMYEGDWDLTLFTCVPNTYNRIAVRCKRVQFSENLN